MQPTSRGAGIFLARVWLEGRGGAGFRARLRFIDHLSAEQRVAHVATPEEFLALVEAWLDGFLQWPGSPGGDPDEPGAPRAVALPTQNGAPERP
jgi:hypothetical protein